MKCPAPDCGTLWYCKGHAKSTRCPKCGSRGVSSYTKYKPQPHTIALLTRTIDSLHGEHLTTARLHTLTGLHPHAIACHLHHMGYQTATLWMKNKETTTP